MKRFLIISPLLAAIDSTWWRLSRPKPIAVNLTEVGYGQVEASISNTHAGSVEACLRT